MKNEIIKELVTAWDEPCGDTQLNGCMTAIIKIFKHTDNKVFFLIELRDFLLNYLKDGI